MNTEKNHMKINKALLQLETTSSTELIPFFGVVQCTAYFTSRLSDKIDWREQSLRENRVEVDERR